jgi:hypothetical protein
LTVIDCVVAPFDHVFPDELDDVNVTDPPEQKVVDPLVVIVGVGGFGFTVTVEADEVEVHEPFDTVTVYEPL